MIISGKVLTMNSTIKLLKGFRKRLPYRLGVKEVGNQGVLVALLVHCNQNQRILP